MKLGFLTACLPDRGLAEIARWAAEHHYETLEVAAWPALWEWMFSLTETRVDAGFMIK
jgi:sugar phosphate isomerase/epimerase